MPTLIWYATLIYVSRRDLEWCLPVRDADAAADAAAAAAAADDDDANILERVVLWEVLLIFASIESSPLSNLRLFLIFASF